MRTRILVGLCALALAAAIGCGDDGDSGGSNGGNNGGNNGADAGGDTGGDAGGMQSYEPFSDDCTTTVGPQATAEMTTNGLLDAFINAQGGDIICMVDGTYAVTGQLDINGVDNIELRGQSEAGTILDFAAQTEGANGIFADGVDNFRATQFTIKNTAGDALKVKNAVGVEMVALTVTWDRGPQTSNGAYGLYPVQTEQVLVEDCTVSYAADAGIYVGQTTTTIVRNNVAFGNVAGIEIENTSYADVYGNEAYNNTGGLLVFNLPDLEVMDGSHAKIHDNDIYENNQPNFAEAGTVVALVPQGTGMLLLATDNNEIHNNTIRDNQSLGLAIISYITTGRQSDDDSYDLYPESNYVHDNTFENNGYEPMGMATQISDALPVPAIVWDGMTNETLAASEFVNCIQNNVTADGSPASFGLVGVPPQDPPVDTAECPADWTALCQYDCQGITLDAVTLE